MSKNRAKSLMRKTNTSTDKKMALGCLYLLDALNKGESIEIPSLNITISNQKSS